MGHMPGGRGGLDLAHGTPPSTTGTCSWCPEALTRVEAAACSKLGAADSSGCQPRGRNRGLGRRRGHGEEPTHRGGTKECPEYWLKK